ncbi:MAG: potassium-transporting ATPase subunit KdpA [Candidatus Xenobia bacterium]
MDAHVLEILSAFLLALVALTPPLGRFVARVFDGQPTLMSRLLGWLERAIYRLGGIDPRSEMDATQYTVAMIVFSGVSMLMTYVVLRLQGALPWNPQHFGTALAPPGGTPVTPDLAFNTAVSFVTNTNWQAYSGETTLSYCSQMVGLTTHNFFSAAVGLALGMAVVRGFSRRMTRQLGNFWVDLVRGVLYVLLPLSTLAALVLIWQGVPENLQPYLQVPTLEGATQTIPQGPVASQEAIKLLGVNGGGFFGANSAHPYENPTPLSNFFQYILIFSLAAALTYTFGLAVKDTRQGWALFSAMTVLFVAGYLVLVSAEAAGNPFLPPLHVAGGNMEGKEVRFGIADSSMFATITTDASCGAVNCQHDSLTPLGGLVTLVNIQLGEIIFGGVGSGLYGILVFAILAIFIAGLMVGRTPEYVGKKIEEKEVKMAMLAVLVLAASILLCSAFAAMVRFHAGSYWNTRSPGTPAARFLGTENRSTLGNSGAHGLTEILYAYSSAAGNNGSAFAGLSANTPFYNLTTALAMLLGRFFFVIPVMAIAGSLACKKYLPASAGTFPTHSPLFVGLLIGVILIVGGLTFFPVLALGPLVEHLQMLGGRLF